MAFKIVCLRFHSKLQSDIKDSSSSYPKDRGILTSTPPVPSGEISKGFMNSRQMFGAMKRFSITDLLFFLFFFCYFAAWEWLVPNLNGLWSPMPRDCLANPDTASLYYLQRQKFFNRFKAGHDMTAVKTAVLVWNVQATAINAIINHTNIHTHVCIHIIDRPGLQSSWKWKTKTDCGSQQLLGIIMAVRQATKSSTRLEQASINSLTKTCRQKLSKHDSWKWNQTQHSVGWMSCDSKGAVWVM